MFRVDGDELNQLAINLPEVGEIFRGFSPTNMIIDRTNSKLRLDVSALENLSISILSDR